MEKFSRNEYSSKLIREGFRRIGEGNQLADRIVFAGNGNLGLRIHNGEHIAAMNSLHPESIILNAQDSIFLVKN
jgi:hypothetical protein